MVFWIALAWDSVTFETPPPDAEQFVLVVPESSTHVTPLVKLRIGS